jgi:hypothetical protein
VDKEQLVGVTNVMTLEDIAWAATGRHRFRAVMVIAFAALALILAMVGVFGMLAYSVQQRVRDFGVRRALGPTTNDVLRLVIANALRRNENRCGPKQALSPRTPIIATAPRCLCSQVLNSVHMKSSARLARAEWERCTVRATRNWDAMSR